MAFGDPPIEVRPWQRVIYEFLGSMTVVLIGIGIVAVGGGAIEHAFAEGFIWFGALAILLLFDAGHFNPVITLVQMALFYFLPGTEGTKFRWYYLGYILVQYLGAVFAGLLVWWLTGLRTFTGLGMPVLGGGVSVSSGIASELIFPTFIIWFYFEAGIVISWFKSGKEFMPHFLKAFVIGFVIVAVTLVGHPISGANFNPFRFLGPALVAWDFGANGHLYIWPPLISALLAGAAIAIQLRYTQGGTKKAPKKKHRANTKILTTVPKN